MHTSCHVTCSLASVVLETVIMLWGRGRRSKTLPEHLEAFTIFSHFKPIRVLSQGNRFFQSCSFSAIKKEKIMTPVSILYRRVGGCGL